MALSDDTIRVLKLVDHDAQFELTQNKSGIEPIILNKFDFANTDYIDELSDLIFSDGSGADFMARCQCGQMEGDNKIGMVCPICNTPVQHTNLLDDDNLICQNWLAAPSELPNGWLTPKIYLNLANWLSYDKNRRNYLDDILDVNAHTPFDIADVIPGKGFGYLYENFDRIIDYFVHDHPVISKKPDTPAMKFCLRLYRDRIFCHYIPILNAAISPIMSSDTGGQNKRRYSDVTADHILKAAVSLSHLEFSPKKKNRQHHVEATAFKAFKDIISYVEESTKKYIATKKAIPRQHVFGARFHWSFRAVITPIVGVHRYYELHAPWKLCVNLLRVHIAGVLFREHNLSINQTVTKIRNALQMYDRDIHLIMNRMIDNSPFKGIPVLWDRPPSIRDGSVMLKYITKVKTDLEDYTVGITSLDVKLPNADFDGDNLAGIILHETEMVKAMKHLSPSALIFNSNTGNVSDEIGIHNSLSVTWNSFLQEV